MSVILGLLLLGGLGVALYSSNASGNPPAPAPRQTSAVPIGLRNNNPGNLRPSDRFTWNGQVGVENGYVVFDTLEHGVRAAYINLRTYFSNGFNTVESIIARWAPDEDNNPTDSYILFVSVRTGFPANRILTFDRPTAYKLLSAMFRFELGQEIAPDVINRGIDLA